jgi:hypothetical protein
MTAPPQMTPQQAFQILTQELSASGSFPINAATNTVPAPNLTLREAIAAIHWRLNASVDLKGTGGSTERPFDPSKSDDILGHILDIHVIALQVLALLSDLAAASGRDVPTILAKVEASL